MIKRKGVDVIDYILEGNPLYISSALSSYYKFEGRILYYHDQNGSKLPSHVTFNDLMNDEYYIDTGYAETDKRDVIVGNPGKWVAKYKFLGDWLYIGMCEDTLKLVSSYSDEDPVTDTGLYPTADEISNCIIRPAFVNWYEMYGVKKDF